MKKRLTADHIRQWNEGSFLKASTVLGAHATSEGTFFAVWAPHAHSVSVVGEFNDWDGRRHPMEKEESTGIWTAFVEGVGQWSIYKYELKTSEDAPPFLKTDPYARAMEVRPKTASLVYNKLDAFEWEDDNWLANREERQSFRKPISIYEVYLASWKRKGSDNSEYLSYRELAHELVPYVKECGFTHLERSEEHTSEL